MKRVFRISLLIAVFLVMSVFTLATASPWEGLFSGYEENKQRGEQVDGIATMHWNAGTHHTSIINATPDSYTGDTVPAITSNSTGTERIGVTLTAKAYIPTFISFTLEGNNGKESFSAFGNNVSQFTSSLPDLIFDNEIGGFVDEDWNSLGYGAQMEIEPSNNHYIQASDYLKASIRSNSFYKYVVNTEPLIGVANGANAGTELPVQMAYKIDDSDWTPSYSNTTTEVISFSDSRNGVTTIWHRFRVPYSDTYLAGAYEGDIVFKIYTL